MILTIIYWLFIIIYLFGVINILGHFRYDDNDDPTFKEIITEGFLTLMEILLFIFYIFLAYFIIINIK